MLIEQFYDGARHETRIALVIDDREMSSWNKERLAMFEDAMWLLNHAVAGIGTTGPLTTPKLGLVIRSAEHG